MSDTSLLILKEQFYDKLCNKIGCDGKPVSESIFKKFLRANVNSVLGFLDSSAVSYDEIDPIIVEELIEKGFIRCGKELSMYVLTAKGIWEIESNLNIVNLQSLLDEIDEYKYDVKWGDKLSDKDKVVILSLVALRAFNEKTPINRKNGEKSLDNIYEVVKCSKEFLENFLEDFNLKLPEETRENPVDAIFARLKELPKKTRFVFKLKDNKSWLDIYSEETSKVSEEKLGYLLWKIFGSFLSFEDQKNVNNFCNKMLYEHKNYIYNSEEIKNFVFSDIAYQNVISNSLFLIAERSATWEGIDKIKKK